VSRTDEVEDEAAIGEAAGGAVEEGLAVGQHGLVGVVREDEAVVARVRQGVPEVEQPREARRMGTGWLCRRQYQ
jgi:hypothetical protein